MVEGVVRMRFFDTKEESGYCTWLQRDWEMFKDGIVEYRETSDLVKHVKMGKDDLHWHEQTSYKINPLHLSKNSRNCSILRIFLQFQNA
jgi:hypothetical protein